MSAKTKRKAEKQAVPVLRKWKLVAKQMAEHISTNMFEAHRGAISDASVNVIAMFGNDGNGGERVNREIAFVRKYLRANKIKELGFGVDSDKYTWVLIVDLPVCRHNEMVDLVWSAWNKACEPAKSNDMIILSIGFEHCQRSIANTVSSRKAKQLLAA